MANYVSSTSDKSKAIAIKKLLSGGIGLHLFYVGKIKAGVIRLVLGVLIWIGMVVGGIAIKEYGMAAAGVGLLVLINLPDLINLSLGKFQDNIGNYLRQ